MSERSGRQTRSGCGSGESAGDGKATRPPVSIAMAGSHRSGCSPRVNIKNGAVAVDQHNAANPGCRVQLKTFDTEGIREGDQVAPPDRRRRIGSRTGRSGVLGRDQGHQGIFNQAGLVAATASATNVTLSAEGWKTFFRGLANDGVQGPAVANYIKNTLGAKKVCDDRRRHRLRPSPAKTVRTTLGLVASADCEISVKKGDKDFAAAMTQIKAQAPDAVFYSGYYAESAPFVQQLETPGSRRPSCPGTAARILSSSNRRVRRRKIRCSHAPADRRSKGEFTDEYTKKFGEAPGTYSTEGFDVATVPLKGIDSGAHTREALLDYVRNYDGQGIARKYQWGANGELTSTLIWMYKGSALTLAAGLGLLVENETIDLEVNVRASVTRKTIAAVAVALVLPAAAGCNKQSHWRFGGAG